MSYHYNVRSEEQKKDVDNILTEMGFKNITRLRKLEKFSDTGEKILAGALPLMAVMNSALLESIQEFTDHNGMTAVCRMKRKGIGPECESRYSLSDLFADTKRAETLKQYNWKALITLRARNITIKKLFPDVILGSELGDIVTKEKQTERQIDIEEAIKNARVDKKEEMRSQERAKIVEKELESSSIRKTDAEEIERIKSKGENYVHGASLTKILGEE